MSAVAPPSAPPTEQDAHPAALLLRRTFAVLASMKLTVVLLVLLALLTWAGTLAQIQDGIYYVQRQYFESWLVWPRINIWGDTMVSLPPLPGAVPVLSVLFVNLLCGGLYRLKKSRRTVGILITHVGILLLLLAGFVKLSVSYAGHQAMWVGDTGSTFRSFSEWELALMWQEGDAVKERIVPGAVVERAIGSRTVRLAAPGLPFDIEVHDFLDHCHPMVKGPAFATSSPVVDGVFLCQPAQWSSLVQRLPLPDQTLLDLLQQLPPAKEREERLAGCYVSVVDHAGGRSSQGVLWAGDLAAVGAPHRPWTFDSGGRTYGLELRHQVWNLPFDIRLDKFVKSEHPGTSMARDFSSYVTVLEGGSALSAHIYMNEPLRKDGYVLYQTRFGQSKTGRYYSVFEVASNPSDQWPKWACFVIAAGMFIHFVMKLGRFMMAEDHRRQRAVNA